MHRAIILSTTAVLLAQGAALAQQSPITTTELTVTGGAGPTPPSQRGTAKVVGSDRTPRPTAPGTTPDGVYTSGAPTLIHCLGVNNPSAGPCNPSEVVQSQVLIVGETITGTAKEHAFRQRFDVTNGGGQPGVGKEGFDTFTHVFPTPGVSGENNAPAVWAMNGNLILEPGARAELATAFELDFDNRSGSACRGSSCHLLWLKADGSPISDVLLLGGGGSADFAIDIEEGASGPTPLARVADIRVQDSAPVGILFEHKVTDVAVEHSVAAIKDTTNGPSAVLVDFATNGGVRTGRKTVASFHDKVFAPSSLLVEGSKSVATLNLADSSPAGLKLTGNHDIGLQLATDTNAWTAINMRPHQRVCWNVNTCIAWTEGDGFIFSNASAQRIARMDNGGNLFLRGQVIQNVQP